MDKKNDNLFSVNSVEDTWTGGGYISSGTGNSHLFGRQQNYRYHSNAQVNRNIDNLAFDLYSFKAIDTEGNTVFECVPCTDPSGTVGIYDLINQVFIESADSSKPFVAGPPI